LLGISHDAPTCLNVNFPDCDASAAGPLTVTRQGVGLVEGIDVIDEVDPRGLDYFWLRFQRGPRENAPDSETAVVASRRVSVTPLHFDRTDAATFATLEAGLRGDA
jgi:5'-nucleotidase